MIKNRSSKPDANQTALAAHVRSWGATFAHTHAIPGALDGIVGFGGVDQRVEIKDPNQPASKQKLTDMEIKTFGTWKGRPPVVIKTKDDVNTLLQRMWAEGQILAKHKARIAERD